MTARNQREPHSSPTPARTDPGRGGALGLILSRQRAGGEPSCPELAAYAQTFHDTLDRTSRGRVLALAASIQAAAPTGSARAERARLATEWLLREFCDGWLRCAGLALEADALRGRSPADAVGIGAWADGCDAGIRARLEGLPAAAATAAWVFADRAAGPSGGAAAAALCRTVALDGGSRTLAAAPEWFTVAWRSWATGWFAANLAGCRPEYEVRAATAVASLRESAFALLASLAAVR